MSVYNNDLAIRLHENDIIAFNTLYWKYHGAVYANALKLTRDAVIAEDIVQEVFLKLSHNFRRAPEDGLLRLWLLRVTRNVALNMLRARARAATRDDRFAKGATPELALTSTVEDNYEQHVELEKALQTLNSLREPMRSCLLLRQQGLSYREIATVLSLNETSVGSLLTRGQKEFMNLYARNGGSR